MIRNEAEKQIKNKNTDKYAHNYPSRITEHFIGVSEAAEPIFGVEFL